MHPMRTVTAADACNSDRAESGLRRSAHNKCPPLLHLRRDRFHEKAEGRQRRELGVVGGYIHPAILSGPPGKLKRFSYFFEYSQAISWRLVVGAPVAE